MVLSQKEKIVSAYALLKFNPAADLLEIYRKLYSARHVLYCDASKGDFNLILLLQGRSFAEINTVVAEKITNMDGLQDTSLLLVDPPPSKEGRSRINGTKEKTLGGNVKTEQLGRTRASSHSADSYVFLEIEKEKFENLYTLLHLNDRVIYGDCTRGQYDLVLLVQGSSFADIDRTIRQKIQALDGVLRIKQCPIIHLFEM